MKRYRAPKVKPGQLKAQLAKVNGIPDFYVFSLDKSDEDRQLIMKAFCFGRYNQASKTVGPPLLEILRMRGYDLETLRFSIEKKQQPQGDHHE